MAKAKVKCRFCKGYFEVEAILKAKQKFSCKLCGYEAEYYMREIKKL
jgi:transposase-like protein